MKIVFGFFLEKLMFEVGTAELGISFKVSVGFQFIETDLNYPLYLFILVSNGAA